MVFQRTLTEQWLAGARGFRDFSRLPPAQENRGQLADPVPAKSSTALIVPDTSWTNRGKLMATDTQKNFELETVLKSVINTLEDGQKGMAEIGEHLTDETLKRYFLAESLKRARFRGELENELHRHGVHDVHETGTVVGVLNRTWGELKAKLGGGDETLLATAEEGEDGAKDAYEDALNQELPLPIRQVLTEQQTHILMSHDFVRGQRDALKGK